MFCLFRLKDGCQSVIKSFFGPRKSSCGYFVALKSVSLFVFI